MKKRVMEDKILKKNLLILSPGKNGIIETRKNLLIVIFSYPNAG
jgi:hypothetical protein